MAAIIIDGVVLIVPVLAIAWLLSLLFPHQGFFFSRSGVSLSSTGTAKTNYVLGLPGFLVMTAVSLSYFFVYEALRGETVGKHAMGLHVRAASGGRAGLNAISARTVLRLIDILPFFYLIGALVAILTGSRRRRIGDWAGGTVVVEDRDASELAPGAAAWRVAVYPALWLGTVLFATFALGLGKTAGEREALARYPSCLDAGISTPAGREGTCVRVSGATGSITTYNVVDRAHTLRMPGYEARILSSRVSSTHVTNSSENEDIYPGGRGQLVSFELMITNPGASPLQFGEPAESSTPSYPSRPTIELSLPTPTGPLSSYGYPAIRNGEGAPRPSVFSARPIAPHGSLVGWVSFVAPSWALALLTARPADIDFFPSPPALGYVGQIRLWK